MDQATLNTCIVMMAGLPGTGKSTLARALAAEVGGVVLDKDIVRAALFPEPWIEYSQQQDDFCMEVLLETAGYLLGRPAPPPFVFIDGRPFAFRYQRERVANWTAQAGCRLKLIYTFCSDETARQRLTTGSHIAKNRNFDSYLNSKARFERIDDPKLTLDTEQSLDSNVSQGLSYLKLG